MKKNDLYLNIEVGGLNRNSHQNISKNSNDYSATSFND